MVYERNRPADRFTILSLGPSNYTVKFKCKMVLLCTVRFRYMYGPVHSMNYTTEAFFKSLTLGVPIRWMNGLFEISFKLKIIAIYSGIHGEVCCGKLIISLST